MVLKGRNAQDPWNTPVKSLVDDHMPLAAYAMLSRLLKREKPSEDTRGGERGQTHQTCIGDFESALHTCPRENDSLRRDERDI